MAKPKIALVQDEFISTRPRMPTAIRRVTRNGMVVGDGAGAGVWLYRKVPLRAVRDVAQKVDTLRAAEPMIDTFARLTELTRTAAIKRREAAKSNYREYHLLWVDVPAYFQASADRTDYWELQEDYGERVVPQRLLLMGVMLEASWHDGGSFSRTLRAIGESLSTSEPALTLFEKDAEQVGKIMEDAGMQRPTARELQVADSWFNRGTANDPELVPDREMLGVLSSPAAARYVEQNLKGTCVADWPEDLPDTHVLSMGSVQHIELDGAGPRDYAAQWGIALMDAGAVCISVRGKLEPPEITRREIEAYVRGIKSDAASRQESNRDVRSEQEEALAYGQMLVDSYKPHQQSPTSTGTSIVVAFQGRVEDMTKVMGRSNILLNPMSSRQRAALAETWIASGARANPHLQDLPTDAIAYSGLISLTRVGDLETPHSALIGFTETDAQPVWSNPRAAYERNSAPLSLYAGDSGSGKALSLDTSIPVPPSGKYPHGWARLGDLERGEHILSSSGRRGTITHLSPIRTPERAWRVVVSDGQSFIADSNHQWLLHCEGTCGAEQAGLVMQLMLSMGETRSDAEGLHQMLTACGVTAWAGPQGVSASLDMMDVTPGEDGLYSAGEAVAALGRRLMQRGWAKPGQVVLSTAEILDLGAEGFWLTPGRFESWDVELPTTPELAAIEVMCAERDTLDPAWLRTGTSQRAELLGALWAEAEDSGPGEVTFPTPALAAQVRELARSLGRIVFEPAGGADTRVRVSQDTRLRIVSIVPATPVPMRCLSVDTSDATYLVGGFVPTHNTQLMLLQATGYARTGSPVICIDPKSGSDHSSAVSLVGGRTIDLGDLFSADGIFDPLRYAIDPRDSLKSATTMLMQCNPWGEQRSNFETPVTVALQYGVARGATCIGQALLMARDNDPELAPVVDPVIALASAEPMFGAMVGRDPQAERLRAAEGITYIRWGDAAIDLPKPGTPMSELTQGDRIVTNLVRSMVIGSASALNGRRGVVQLDEAWVFLGNGNAELLQLARVARSQTVSVMLYTQRVTDASAEGIEDFISSGAILPLPEREARHAFKLLRVDPDEALVERLTRKATQVDADGVERPDWRSMHALIDQETRKVERGSVAFVVDLYHRTANVEIVLPKRLLARSSTHYRDIEARKKREAAEALARESYAGPRAQKSLTASQHVAETRWAQDAEHAARRDDEYMDSAIAGHARAGAGTPVQTYAAGPDDEGW